jgi:hypothetical protein
LRYLQALRFIFSQLLPSWGSNFCRDTTNQMHIEFSISCHVMSHNATNLKAIEVKKK